MNSDCPCSALMVEVRGRNSCPERNTLNSKESIYVVDGDCLKAFQATLKEESDRARVIVAAAWIDLFLEAKLRNEFGNGNARARKDLFSEDGPFSSSAAKAKAVYCAGWIPTDLYHDATVIRKLRNRFAHTVDSVSLNDSDTRRLIESLKVPQRQYYDWGEIRAAALPDGAVIYTGDKPKEASGGLHIPGRFTFQLAIPLILAVLAAKLGILFTTDAKGCLLRIRLPEHMDNGCS